LSGLLSAAGVEPGDRVGIMLPNVPAFPIAFYGALAAGAVRADEPPVQGREIGYYLGDSGARVLLAWHTAAGEAAKGATDAGAQVLVCPRPPTWPTCSPGTPPPLNRPVGAARTTTSRVICTPRGPPASRRAPVTHANMTTATPTWSHGPCCRTARTTVTMGCLPLVHSLRPDLRVLNATVAAAGTLTLLPGSTGPGARDHPARRGDDLRGRADYVRRHAAQPDGDPAQTATLRTCISAAPSLPLEILRGFEEKFGCVILEGYGLSGDLTGRVVQPPGPAHRKPGSIGVPGEGVQRCD